MKLFWGVNIAVAGVLLEHGELQERRREVARMHALRRGRRGEGVPQGLRVVERGTPVVVVFAARGVRRGHRSGMRDLGKFVR